jgi:hypothetical protein
MYLRSMVMMTMSNCLACRASFVCHSIGLQGHIFDGSLLVT